MKINEAVYQNPNYVQGAKGMDKKTIEKLLKEKKADLLSISNFDIETENGKKAIAKKCHDELAKILPSGASISKRNRVGQMNYFEIVNTKYESEFGYGKVCELRLNESMRFWREDEITDFQPKDWSFSLSSANGDFSEEGHILKFQLVGDTLKNFSDNIQTFLDLAKEEMEYVKERYTAKKDLEATDPAKELKGLAAQYFSQMFEADLKNGAVWIPRKDGDDRWIIDDNSRRRGRSYYNNVVDSIKIVKVKPKTVAVEYTYHYEGRNGERQDERDFTSEINNSRGHLFSMWKRYVMDPKTDIKTGFEGIKWRGFDSPKSMLSEYIQ